MTGCCFLARFFVLSDYITWIIRRPEALDAGLKMMGLKGAAAEDPVIAGAEARSEIKDRGQSTRRKSREKIILGFGNTPPLSAKADFFTALITSNLWSSRADL